MSNNIFVYKEITDVFFIHKDVITEIINMSKENHSFDFNIGKDFKLIQ